jgi:glycosyltransferase involved in cell wall biosynthesis
VADRKLLYFFRGDECDGKPSFAAPLEAQGWQIDCVPVSDFARAHGVLDVFRWKGRFSDYDLVAANEYFLTWAVCLRASATRGRPIVVALSFNQSRRLLLTGLRPLDRLLNRVWRRAAMFLVHSNAEAELFARLHDLPLERFIFAHWGYDLPSYETPKVELPAQPYVTMIGRNNRDLKTFAAAVERAGVRGVAITAGYMVERYPVETSCNIWILADRPMDECLAYIAGSFAHLVLVLDADRGAGHISAVTAMLMAKPQIFSEVAPLSDYLIDGLNGIAVPVGDAEAVASAIRSLQSDPATAERLGVRGREFALKSMSHEAATSSVVETLIAASS